MRLVRTSLFLIAALAAACSTTPHASPHPASDWCQTAIAQLTEAQRALYEKKKAQGTDYAWMLTTPGPPATEASILSAESRLGTHFDQQYTDWLRHVNGWESFADASDFFPIEHISRNSMPAQNLGAFIDAAEITPEELGINSFSQLVVIGGSIDGDAYFIAIQGAPDSATASMPVYIFSHGDFIKYDDFKTFIQKKIELLKR